MPRQTAFIDGILEDEDLLEKLCPTETGYVASLRAIRAATDEELTGGKTPADPEALTLVRAALLYAHDAIDEAHRIAQDGSSGAASYLHGMIHRREGDFDNARYWFRRSGRLGFFDDLHAATASISADMAKQENWDPYLFTGLCEQDEFGDHSRREVLVELQRREFDAFFDYVWRKSAGA
jgi:hypothetical protein